MIVVRAHALEHFNHRFVLAAAHAGSFSMLMWLECSVQLGTLRASHAVKANVIVAHLLAREVERVFVDLPPAAVAVKLAPVDGQRGAFETAHLGIREVPFLEGVVLGAASLRLGRKGVAALEAEVFIAL